MSKTGHSCICRDAFWMWNDQMTLTPTPIWTHSNLQMKANLPLEMLRKPCYAFRNWFISPKPSVHIPSVKFDISSFFLLIAKAVILGKSEHHWCCSSQLQRQMVPTPRPPLATACISAGGQAPTRCSMKSCCLLECFTMMLVPKRAGCQRRHLSPVRFCRQSYVVVIGPAVASAQLSRATVGVQQQAHDSL